MDHAPVIVTISRPDDWHLHLRDGERMRAVVGATARTFARAVVMPNLSPPVTTVAAAAAYRDRILSALPASSTFAPLMTLYLTDDTSAEEIIRARESGFVIGVKYYPAGATTNSASGVTDLKRVTAAIAAMEKHGLPLLVHARSPMPTSIFSIASECSSIDISRIWSAIFRRSGWCSSTSRRPKRRHSSTRHPRTSEQRLRLNICHGRATPFSQGGCARISIACRC